MGRGEGRVNALSARQKYLLQKWLEEQCPDGVLHRSMSSAASQAALELGHRVTDNNIATAMAATDITPGLVGRPSSAAEVADKIEELTVRVERLEQASRGAF